MRQTMLVAVFGLALSAQAQEHPRPKVALLPLDVPVAKLGSEQAALDDFWAAQVARAQPAELANAEAVRAALGRKFPQGCPEEGLADCLAWVAEQTGSAYAVHARLRKVSPRGWQLAATIGAPNKAQLPQPAMRPFVYVESAELTLKAAVERQLEEYAKVLGLEAPVTAAAPVPAPALEVTLTPVPKTTPPPLGSAVKPGPTPASPEVASSRRWGVVSLSAGAVAAGIGAAFGAMTWSTAGKATSGPPEQFAATIAKAKGQAGLANASFAVAGALGAAGAVMLVVHF